MGEGYTIPKLKAPPKHMQEQGRAERARRKACHGNWHECTIECMVGDGRRPALASASHAEEEGNG